MVFSAVRFSDIIHQLTSLTNVYVHAVDLLWIDDLALSLPGNMPTWGELRVRRSLHEAHSRANGARRVCREDNRVRRRSTAGRARRERKSMQSPLRAYQDFSNRQDHISKTYSKSSYLVAHRKIPHHDTSYSTSPTNPPVVSRTFTSQPSKPRHIPQAHTAEKDTSDANKVALPWPLAQTPRAHAHKSPFK